MQNSRVNLGIIGTGLATRNLHWPALELLSEYYTIKSVSSRTQAKAESFGKMVETDSVFTDYKKMLTETDLDAVLIAVPIEYNYPISLDCAKAGVNIMCEKPVAVNLEQGRKMIDIPDKYKIKLQIAEQFYYRDDLNRAAELINQGVIGDVFQIRMDVTVKVNTDDGYGATEWRIKPAHRAGFVTDAGVHHMAELRLLAGEIEGVHAFALNKSDKFGGIDNICMNIQFCSGIIGHYSASYTAICPEPYTVRTSILGTKGTLEVRYGEIFRYKKLQDENPEYISFDHFDGGFRNQWIEFYKSIVEDKPIVSSPQRTFKDLQVICCALDSMRSRKVVKIPED